MGFLKNASTEQTGAQGVFQHPDLDLIDEQARAAELARRTTLVLRLPADDAAVGDVGFWSAAVQRAEQYRWKLEHVAVDNGVGYYTFGR